MSPELVRDEKVVLLHYELRDESGDLIACSEPNAPLCCIQGSGQLPLGLERALHGRAAGDRFALTLSPEEGFGPRRPSGGLQALPRQTLPPDAPLTPWRRFQGEDPRGEVFEGWIVGIDGDIVLYDLQHPLAGETLQFQVEIVEVREATDQERAQRHPDGEPRLLAPRHFEELRWVVDLSAWLTSTLRAHGVEAEREAGVVLIGPDRLETALVALLAPDGRLLIEARLQLPDGRALVEHFDCWGADRQEQINDGLMAFAQSDLHVLLEALCEHRCEHAIEREAHGSGDARRVLYWGPLGCRHRADVTHWEAPQELQERVREAVLGAPLFPGWHWFRFYHAQGPDGEETCAALCDNQAWDEGIALLGQLSWPPREGYLAHRLFLLVHVGAPLKFLRFDPTLQPVIPVDHEASRGQVRRGKRSPEYRATGARVKAALRRLGRIGRAARPYLTLYLTWFALAALGVFWMEHCG